MQTDWDGIATIIQAVGTVVALIGVAATVLLTRRGQRQDAERVAAEAERAERANRASEAAAERSERAAALTIDTLERIAEAVERLADNEPAGNTLSATAPPGHVRWSLKHHDGDTYLLENIGHATAFAVDLSASETMIGPHNIQGGPDVEPNQAITFLAARTLGTDDSTITVRWKTDPENDSEDEWRYPLPPRPPRG
ncbi:hypothetical protein ACEXQE_14630 [Herbiconiux sp. P17]|uniref:hypothetical protein n=1 Tax=Herbiconiux wuyangfengii TaxID=3342794 RepID=UPI0035B9FA1F